MRHKAGDGAGAASLWRRAARLGKASAARFLAHALLRAGDRVNGLRWLRRAAARGDAAAMHTAYGLGLGPAAYLETAAALGHAGACREVASGRLAARTADSVREAVLLLRRAAANGGAERVVAHLITCRADIEARCRAGCWPATGCVSYSASSCTTSSSSRTLPPSAREEATHARTGEEPRAKEQAKRQNEGSGIQKPRPLDLRSGSAQNPKEHPKGLIPTTQARRRDGP